jgi:hypothetical protein
MNDSSAPSSNVRDRYYQLQQYLGIDLSELEDAFMKTPRVLQDAAELAARADFVHSVAKHTLEIVKAEAGARIRAVLVGGKEPSEARIAASVPLDEEVKQAFRAIDDAAYEADICTALHKSLHEQVYLLNKAADMVLAGFITPTSINEHRRAQIHAVRTAMNSRGPIARPSD